jgi:hypothetical protein
MGDSFLWVVWAAAVLTASAMDPVTWFMFVVAALFASDRLSTAVVVVAALALGAFGIWLTIEDQALTGVRQSWGAVILFHVIGKLLFVALGVACNRWVVQRIEKRLTGVLEKTGTH